jgi:hypothetical protein
MNEHILINLSGRSVPPLAKLTIAGEPKPGDYLVIETAGGPTGAAAWRSAPEVAALQASHGLPTRPDWAPPMKAKLPYS